MSSTPSPAFFGRAHVLLSEQKRFVAVVGALRELCSALEAGLSTLPEGLEPPHLAAELDLVLTHHFEGTEESLKTVASRRPDLLPSVVDLRADHAALAQMLLDLRFIVADGMRWSELPPRITSLLGAVEAHREAEAALVQDAAER